MLVILLELVVQLMKTKISYLTHGKKTLGGFIFGKWIGTLVVVTGLSVGATFLYIFGNYFLRDYGFVDWSKIMDLLDGESGKKIYSNSHVLFKERSKLILREINVIKNFSCKINNLDKKLTLENGAYLSFKDVQEVEKVNFNIITVDKGRLKLPLKLRYFNHGDSFSPFGMNGTKKGINENQKKKIEVL